MKKEKVLIYAFAMIMVATVFVGCQKDEPKADVRESYVGSYRTNYEYFFDGMQYTGTYTLTIVKSSTNANDIILNNIDGWGESARASVNGNSMTIPQQTILEYGVSGSGTLNGNVLNFSTQETQTGGVIVNVTQTATKQ